MATKNDITGDKLISKTNTDKYRDNFAAIFNKTEPDYNGEVRKKPEEKIEETKDE